VLKPLLPSHLSVWVDPPDEAGDEVLHVVSEQRSLKLKGHSFREFRDEVLPLLDGAHTVEEIQAATVDTFRPEDLMVCLDLLTEQGVLVEGDTAPAGRGGPGAAAAKRLAPQANLFHELAPGANVQERLAAATVAVVGLGGAGASVALTLAAAGVGSVVCVDPAPVAPADVYFSPYLGLANVGSGRASSTAALIAASAPQVKVDVVDRPMETEDDLRAAVVGADIVVCCLDAGQSNLIFKLNRVCLAENMRWLTCALAGAEVDIGPVMVPRRTACYLCYRMRVIACAGNPEEAFAYEQFLDGRKRDDSARRENLVFAAGIAAGFVGSEVVKLLTDLAPPTMFGRLTTVRLTDMAVERHSVLRKPWCPACFVREDGGGAG
jgi:bacteriocin biosynthesis cyclodehydratase domain-containing protein